MLKKRIAAILLTATLLICFFCIDASASDIVKIEEVSAAARASGRFSTTIAANSSKKTSLSFSLEAGDYITIKATYSPSGSVDFGYIDSNNSFHYIRVSDGTISKKLKIQADGKYTFAIRNNSSYSITVSGYVNY